MMKLFLSVLAFLFLSFGLVAQKSVGPDPIGLCWGESTHFYTATSADRDYYDDHLSGMGVERHKMYIKWKDIDTVKGNEPGTQSEYNWDKLDKWLDILPDNGEAQLTIFTVGTMNYGGFQNHNTLIFTGKGNPIRSGYIDEYEEFITAVVNRCDTKVKYYNRDTESFNAGDTVWTHWPKSHNSLGYDRDFFVKAWVDTQEAFYNGVHDHTVSNHTVYVIGIENDGSFPASENGKPFNWDCWDSQTGIFSMSPNIEYHWDLVAIRNYGDLYEYRDKIDWFELQFAGTVPDWVCTECGGPDPRVWTNGWSRFKTTLSWWATNASDEWKSQNWDTFLTQLAADRDAYPVFVSIPPNISIILGEATAAEDKKRDAIQGRDFAQRGMVMMNAGCKWFIRWSLYADWSIDDSVEEWPHNVFGKMRHFDDRDLSTEEGCHDAFELFVDTFQDMTTIQKLNVAGQEDVHYYECCFSGSENRYCAWEERHTYSGNDDDAISVTLDVPDTWSTATITKWDGTSNSSSVNQKTDTITVLLKDDPVYITKYD